jgi:glycosyltransferase involved in cell wall biosynthesis
VGGIPDVVKDGVTGILVPPGEPMSLSEGILLLLQDPGLRERMGQAARQRINEKFSARTMVQGIVDVYNDCLSQKVQVFSEEERFRYIEKALNKRKVG